MTVPFLSPSSPSSVFPKYNPALHFSPLSTTFKPTFSLRIFRPEKRNLRGHPPMAIPFSPTLLVLFIYVSFSLPQLSLQQQQNPSSLNSAEQESVYLALESVNSNYPWRTLFPDDLCLSSPHGVLCDYFPSDLNNDSSPMVPHIVELNFGFVSDYSPNPPCSYNANFPASVSSFPHLKKLFFYNCFTHNPVSFPVFVPGFGSMIEELVFMDNPSLVATSLDGTIGNFTSLRRLILSGSRNVSGRFPNEITGLYNMEQLTISGNSFGGRVPESIGRLNKLRILDLSNNGFDGSMPESVGNLKKLLKLDLSSNKFVGRIPESLKGLEMVEFLDLSHNRFGNFGVPLFLGQMQSLREVYLSGNKLGGTLPEIWENLEGILGIGLSDVGLVGKIPASMGVFLRNAVYISLDNNKLEGPLPGEFGLLDNVHEMNLQNNKLSGRVPFPAKFVSRIGKKLKLEGNPDLCIDSSSSERITATKSSGNLGNMKICNRTAAAAIPRSVLVNSASAAASSSLLLHHHYHLLSWYYYHLVMMMRILVLGF